MHPFDSKDYRGVSFASQNCFDKLGFSLSKQFYVTNSSVCQGQFYSHKAGIFDKIKLGGSFVSTSFVSDKGGPKSMHSLCLNHFSLTKHIRTTHSHTPFHGVYMVSVISDQW